MTTSIFSPDADPETTSVDGFIREFNPALWDIIRGADPGGIAADVGDLTSGIRTGGSTNIWTIFDRSILLFDTSVLPDDDVIESATLEFVVLSLVDDYTESISLVASNPASNTALVVADYAQLGTTKQAPDLTLASLTANDSTINTFVLNSAGLASISKTGITKFGMRITADVDDAEPLWVANSESTLIVRSAETGGKQPRLLVVHNPEIEFAAVSVHHLSLPRHVRIM